MIRRVARRLPCALMALVLTPAFALAQDVPSFDCTRAQSAAEKLVCGDPALAALDRRLADRYAAALDRAGSLDAGAAAATGTLKASQRGWIKGRDACWKAAELQACVEESYILRSGELVALWLLEEPIAETVWQCGESPADELVTMAFAAERPALRLERGDSVEFAVEVPSASGELYEGAFGLSLLVQGDEATLEWPQGTPASCVRR